MIFKNEQQKFSVSEATAPFSVCIMLSQLNTDLQLDQYPTDISHVQSLLFYPSLC